MDNLKYRLQQYILADEENWRRKSSESRRKLGLNRILPAGYDHQDDNYVPPPLHQPSRRPYPVLVNEKGEEILKLILFNLPPDVKEEEIRHMLKDDVSNFTIYINNQKAWITLTSLEDSLTIQCNSRDNKYCFQRPSSSIYKVRVTPALNQPKTKRNYQLGPVIIPTDYLSRLPCSVIEEIMKNLNFQDTLAFMCVSKYMLMKTYPLRRNLIIEKNTRQPIIKSSSLHFYVRPFNVKQDSRAVMKRIILKDQRTLTNISVATLSFLTQISYLSLEELDLSGVTSSSTLIGNVARNCSVLKTFILGNTTRNCDTEISTLFDKSNKTSSTITKFGIANNKNFTSSGLLMTSANKSTATTCLTLKECKKLHGNLLLQFLEGYPILHLIMENNDSVGTITYKDFIKNLGKSNVTNFEIVLEKYHTSEWMSIREWVAPFTSLRNLKITRFKGIECEVINCFLQNSPNLTDLHISHFKIANCILRFDFTIIEHLHLKYVQYREFWNHHIGTIKSITITNAVTSLKLLQKFILNNRSIQLVDLRKAGRLDELENFLELQFQSSDRIEQLPIKIVFHRNLRKVCRAINRQFRNQRKPPNPLIVIDY